MHIADDDRYDARTARELEAIDHAVPTPDVDAIISLGRARIHARRQKRYAMAAAAAVLFTAASAAALLPGARVRAWLRGAEAVPTQSVARPPQPRGREQAAVPAGVAFVPREEVEIRFRATQPSGVVRVVLSDSGRVRVTHSGGLASYFLTSRGVSIDNGGSSASYEVVMPSSVAKGSVLVAGRTAMTIEAGRVRGASRDTAGGYVLSLKVR